MAHLWIRSETEQWAVMPLEGDAFTLTANPPRIHERSGESESINDVLLIRARTQAAWVLVAGAGTHVSVNGAPVRTGLCVVADHDEIRVGDADSVYFSTETLARIEQFTGVDQTMFCPRCKQEIAL